MCKTKKDKSNFALQNFIGEKNMLKRTTNKKTVAIVVLATLLVALLAFNVTYAYFTDKVQTSATIDFGIIDVNATDFAATNATNVMPGDSFGLKGTLSIGESTDDMWVYIGLVEDSVKLYYGADDTEIAADTTKNVYYDDNGAEGAVQEGAGHTYSTGDISNMKSKVVTAINANLVDLVNKAAGSTSWKLGQNDASVSDEKIKNIANVKVDDVKEYPLNLANGGSIELTASEFGNLFQNVKIEFSIVIYAMQADNVTLAQFITAMDNANFESGVFTIA
jgi:predicted ribosomally synthesized peptide with SipW-like signal peptide